MEAPRYNIFQKIKEKNFQPNILYPEKISFNNEWGKSSHCQDEGKLRNFIISRPTLKRKKAKGNSKNRNKMTEGHLEKSGRSKEL